MGLRANIARLENGPPVGFPVQFRVSGEDIADRPPQRRARRGGDAREPERLERAVRRGEKAKVIKVDIDQEKVRLLGLSSQDLSTFLNTSLNGLTVTHYRERDKLIEVLMRGADRGAGEAFLPAGPRDADALGKVGPAQLRSRRSPTASRTASSGAATASRRSPSGRTCTAASRRRRSQRRSNRGSPRSRRALPPGYRLETGGAVEDSAKGQKSVAAGFPLFILVVLTVLMIQLQSFSRVAMVVLTAPLGLIGVAAFMLLFNQPFGFVAMLGTIALSGMIMRNSVILVDQIDQDIRAGHAPRSAVVEATVRRFRPIMLTAAAAVLAMIPLTRSAFFGPMAVAIMGGLVVATALTVLFLPALYAAWFRVPAAAPPRDRPAAPPAAVAEPIAPQMIEGAP